MLSKFDKFNELPPELRLLIADSATNKELVHMAMTSKYSYRLFRPLLDVRMFLHYVVCGNHAMVDTLLQQDFCRIYRRGFVIDCSGREFESVSGFEYALWALDKHMWAKMIACIPSEETSKRVFEQLLAQYDRVKTIGLTYKLNGKISTEKHFDFANILIGALKTQLDLITAPIRDWRVIDNHWRTRVGWAQKLLPMHIIDEYCSDVSFNPIPEFIAQPKSSKALYNWKSEKLEQWPGSTTTLGVDFAIYKGPMLRNGSCAGIQSLRMLVLGQIAVRIDLAAMTKLSTIRIKDFFDFESQLEELSRPKVTTKYLL